MPIRYLADRKSTRLNSSHSQISYAVFCLKKKKKLLGCKTTRLISSHTQISYAEFCSTTEKQGEALVICKVTLRADATVRNDNLKGTTLICTALSSTSDSTTLRQRALIASISCMITQH